MFIKDLEETTITNNKFRKIVYTKRGVGGIQFVLMSINPEKEIGMEKHDKVSQFIRIERGNGILVIKNKNMSDCVYKIKHNTSFIIPAGTWHNVINTSKTRPLKLYTIYTPPEH